MSHDDDWPDNTVELRKAAVRETIRPVSIDELKNLGEELFPVVSDPWYERFHSFLKDHAREKFYRAEIGSETKVVYCRDANRGMWFVPGFAMGFMRPRALAAFAEIVDKKK